MCIVKIKFIILNRIKKSVFQNELTLKYSSEVVNFSFLDGGNVMDFN